MGGRVCSVPGSRRGARVELGETVGREGLFCAWLRSVVIVAAEWSSGQLRVGGFVLRLAPQFCPCGCQMGLGAIAGGRFVLHLGLFCSWLPPCCAAVRMGCGWGKLWAGPVGFVLYMAPAPWCSVAARAQVKQTVGGRVCSVPGSRRGVLRPVEPGKGQLWDGEGLFCTWLRRVVAVAERWRKDKCGRAGLFCARLPPWCSVAA